jgi:hypothetical protein
MDPRGGEEDNDDGGLLQMDWMVNVASEEWIDGVVENGNPDLRDQKHFLWHAMSYKSKCQKSRE